MSLRDYLETKRWYWFSINLSFNVFPWHWVGYEYTNYGWGKDWKFGPFGILVLWDRKTYEPR